MFDTLQTGSSPDNDLSYPGEDGPTGVPLERLEAQICELAGHLAAATCRFLVLLGDFDARRGWASWDMSSCASWLSWKCQMSSGTAREHVRVARALVDNLVSLCKYHHVLVHERGYLIAAARDGTFAFYRPDGTAIPSSPALPNADGAIEGCHDADITPDTIIPPWYGERLDLDHAIYVCFANAANQARQHDNAPPPTLADQLYQAGQTDQADQAEPIRPRRWAIEPQDWMPSLRREYTIA